MALPFWNFQTHYTNSLYRCSVQQLTWSIILSHHHIILSLAFLIEIIICNKNSFLASHGILFRPLCCLIVMFLYCSVFSSLFIICYLYFIFFFFNYKFQHNLFLARGKKDYLQSTWDHSEKLFILWINIICIIICVLFSWNIFHSFIHSFIHPVQFGWAEAWIRLGNILNLPWNMYD